MRWASLLAAAAALAATSATADPHVRVSPYLEAAQVLDADLTSDDAVTYTELAAGVDASVDTAHASAQVDYRYEHRFPEAGAVGDADVHTGLARASYRLAQPLTIEAGAIATRARSDIRGAAPLLTDTALSDNLTEVYSAYAGPTLATQAGPLDIGASYRFGWTKAEAPGAVTLAPGTPRLDYFDESTGHAVAASVGARPGRLLPVGVTLSGGWERDDASQLDQRYSNLFGRGDVLLPVTRTLALTAGVGWQRLTVAERDPVRDATGAPVLDSRGRLETDKASPRHLDYHTDGLIYDVGVVWHPSQRTSLTATVAHQYDATTFTGDFRWEVEHGVAINVDGYDAVETFGHQLRQGLQALPTGFLTQSDSFGQQFNGCVFAAQPSQGAGGCLNDVFQSILTSSYRARGIDAVLVARRGRNNIGLGAGYADRHLLTPDIGPGIQAIGLDDHSWYLQAFYSRLLDRRSTFDLNVFADSFDSDLPGGAGVSAAGATGAYTRSFGRLGTTAQLGVYTYSQDGLDDQWTAQALLGARYQF